MKAIAHGVPVLSVPLGRDQADNAARTVEAGAGLRLAPKARVLELQRAPARLLDEPSVHSVCSTARRGDRPATRPPNGRYHELEARSATRSPLITEIPMHRARRRILFCALAITTGLRVRGVLGMRDHGRNQDRGAARDAVGHGLFSSIATDTLADRVVAYRPQFELWSDGADKHRCGPLHARGWSSRSSVRVSTWPVTAAQR
jgi:hypothetical protein